MSDKKLLMNGEHWRQSGLSAVLTAAITAGTLIGYLQINPPRDDPFRGVEATELRRELEAKITAEAEKTRAALQRLDDAHREVMQDNMIRLRQLESRTWPQ